MDKSLALKVFKRLALFSFLLAAIYCSILLLPFDKQYGYNQMLKSCDKGNWIYSRIFLNKTPIDVAFIGTSHTDCGIDDGLLESLIKEKTGDSLHIANFGFCRFGRTLDYAIIKDMLKYHHPKMIVMEMQSTETRYSHEDFPCIADTKDLIGANFYPGYIKQLVKGIHYRWRYQLGITDEYPPYRTSDIVKNNKHRIHEGKKNKLVQEKDKKKKNKPKVSQDTMTPYSAYSLAYVKKIAAIAKEQHIELRFLYMPKVCSHAPDKPVLYEEYSKLGQIWLPPMSIYNTPEYCVDYHHLTSEGATALTNWLALQFVQPQ